MIVNNLVWNWLVLMVEEKMVAHERLGLWVGRCLGLFYAGNDMVELRDPGWI